ncbi:MAG: HD domain-containing protein, partial [Planctomycetes bacterium]|nr:HD domain-containing protein [Planctomycetota bacterium]
MVLPSPKNMMRIVTNTLNLVDARLIDHGMNVGTLVSHVLRQGSRFSRKEIHDIVIAAVLHDIGAYKTEEIDRMVEFELHDVWSHSVYGNLYLKHFSPLADVAPAILFHHADYRRFKSLSGTSAEVGQIINIADRVDILSRHGLRKGDDFLKYFEQQRGRAFRPDLLDQFQAADVFRIVSERGIDNHLGIELDFDEQECLDYIKMVVLPIDLRSKQTVTHTMAVAAGARGTGPPLQHDGRRSRQHPPWRPPPRPRETG